VAGDRRAVTAAPPDAGHGGRPSLVGARVLRVNDARLLSGAGGYVDDLELAGTVHAAIMRSPVPHGRVRAFEAGAALRVPGAIAVIGPKEAAERTATLPCVWIMQGQRMDRYPVVSGTLRYAGQPAGVVVAGTRAAAEDMLDAVRLDLEELPAVADAEAAVRDGAPLLYPEFETNVLVEMDRGDPPAAIEEAMAGADHVVSLRLRVQRLSGIPLESRGVVARWEAATGELTMWSSTQVPHHVRDGLADALRLPHDRVRVIAPGVGGGFGTKDHLYADEVLVCLAAIRLGRPVKWIEDRHEHFTASTHGRDHVHDARLALAADGRFVAIHSRLIANLGAHASNVGAGPALVSSTMLPGPYRFEAAGANIRGVATNTTPIGAYRGFGMQQAAWVRERLVEEAARRLGLDSYELRRRNMLSRDELPYTTRTFQNYDSGDYVEALDRAVERIRQGSAPPADGRRRGIGLAPYVEFTGLGPTAVQQLVNFRLSGYETAVVRMEPDGSATVLTGVCSQGQGLETSLAQLVADKLGLELEDVKVVMGDTASAPYSSAGTIASRSMAIGGGAVVHATAVLHDKITAIAAERLEAAPADIELVAGEARVRGAPSSALALRTIAESAWLGWDLPEGMEPGLEQKHVHNPKDISYSYATHAAAVAVDVETGEVEVERYVVVHDCGVVVNPMIVDGQIHGGTAQGLGGALSEAIEYEPDGRPLTHTLLDYLVPTSGEVPDIVVEHTEHPSPFVPGGMKGMGEGGAIAPAAAIGNALAAAIPEIADLITETPMTPVRLRTWIRERARQ
jgi:carbon-monoxide dehydrogenase large subunit